MKAAAFRQTGGPEVIEFIDLDEPVPGPGEVIVRLEAVGLNFADIYRRRGEYESVPPSPYVLGYEGAGIVTGIGSGGHDFSVGTRVGFAHVPRANAEFVIAPAWKVVALPNEISFDVAASTLLQGLTAHYLTHDSFSLKRGDTALVHSASGGVGSLLLQICRMIGVRAFATVSHAAKVPLARHFGAEAVIVRDRNWPAEVIRLTNGRGVDVVYDAIGSTVLESLSAVRSHGTVVYYGQAGGFPPSVDPNLLMAESKVLVGGELWSHLADRKALENRSKDLFAWIRDGKVAPAQITRYPLSRAAEAHAALESGHTQGKILLIP